MLLFLAPAQGHAATFTVNSEVDAAGQAANCVSGAGTCSLRSAVQAANAAAGPDTINLPAGIYILTVTGAGEDAAATGDLDITAAGGALTITGAGAVTTIIDGNNADRVFQTIGAATATISGVTLENGNVVGNGGAIATSGGTNLTLNNVSITGNTSSVEGGAIDLAANVASVTVMNTVTITNNTSGAGGDIIAHGAGGTLTITNGNISGNHEIAIGNKAGSTLTLTNVTISGNTSAGGVAAIDNLGTANLQNVTVHLNTAAVGAGNGGLRNQGGAVFNVRNTIISNNAPQNCIVGAAFTSQGNNLTSDNTCGLAGAGDVNNTVPLLGALADNGGALQTHALLIGSPAIDAGTATGCPAADARGIARPKAGKFPPGAAICDIGAFEFRPQQIVVTLPSPFDFGTVTAGTFVDHTITLTNAGDGDLNIASVAGTNLLAAPFAKQVDNCSGLTLKLIPVTAANSCTITTRFNPTAAVASSDTFDIQSNDPVTPISTFALSGTGTATLVPLISVTDSIAPNNDNLVPFGGVAVGGSADATITVTNTGAANLIIGTIGSPDPLAPPFSIIADACSGKAIAPAASCTLTVRFAPTNNTAASDTFDIPSTGLPAVTITVSGTGGTSTTGNNAPSNPVLVTPASGQAGVPTTMTFVWNKSVDPDGDAVTYHFQNCTDANFTTGCINSDVAAAAPSGILFAGLGSFGVGFILFGFVKRSRMTMLVLTLLLFSGALFMSCSKSSDETPPPQEITAGQISNIVRTLAPNTTYYWKVVADDGKGGLASSEVRSYTTAP